MTDALTPAAESYVVVDTDVISFWQRNDSRGADYRVALEFRSLAISFQSLGELLL